jgi:hypothetical protein
VLGACTSGDEAAPDGAGFLPSSNLPDGVEIGEASSHQVVPPHAGTEIGHYQAPALTDHAVALHTRQYGTPGGVVDVFVYECAGEEDAVGLLEDLAAVLFSGDAEVWLLEFAEGGRSGYTAAGAEHLFLWRHGSTVLSVFGEERTRVEAIATATGVFGARRGEPTTVDTVPLPETASATPTSTTVTSPTIPDGALPEPGAGDGGFPLVPVAAIGAAAVVAAFLLGRRQRPGGRDTSPPPPPPER